MLTLIIALIVIILLAGIGYWAVTQLAAALGLPAPVVVIAQVLIVLVAAYAIVQKAGVGLDG